MRRFLVPIDSIADVRLFRQVVASGGISAAARALHDNKNRVSQRLAALERGLGVRLLHRTTRSIRLTEEGERLLATADALLEAVERSERAVAARQVEGRVRVAVRSVLAGFGIGPDIVRLQRVAPKLEIQLVVLDDDANVIAHGFDLAVQIGKLADSALVARRIGLVTVVLAATPGYLDDHGRPATPADLAKHACIRKLDRQPETSWSLVDQSGRRARARIGGAFECSDARFQSEVLYAGGGIGLRPAEEVRRAAAAGTLERVLPAWSFQPIPVYAVGPKGSFALPRVAAIVAMLEAAVGRL